MWYDAGRNMVLQEVIMYPLKFENIYFDKIWGGRGFESFRDNLPEGAIGESWDIACHPNGTGIVSNGEWKGKSLLELFENQREAVIGTGIHGDRFPLLLKMINSSEALSVQVHPEDAYALREENDLGKTEAWYVMAAEEGSYLIVGTRHCTKDMFRKAIEENRLDQYMNKVSVKPGDVFYIKAGLVHAIGPGLVIYEIQQNSDTTYRVYDYGRPRELHVEKSLHVTNFALKGEKMEGLRSVVPGGYKTYLILNRYFSLEKYELEGLLTEKSDPGRFHIFTVVEGQGGISWADGDETLVRGESIMIPASLGQYTFRGDMKLLKSYVPDVEAVRAEILQKIQ
jgi:mannose-6-phosphate isomerase